MVRGRAGVPRFKATPSPTPTPMPLAHGAPPPHYRTTYPCQCFGFGICVLAGIFFGKFLEHGSGSGGWAVSGHLWVWGGRGYLWRVDGSVRGLNRLLGFSNMFLMDGVFE